MRQLPSRWRRLDGALGDLPLEEPMLLTELDGFLTGIVVCGQAIPVLEWMQSVWGPEGDGVPPFEDPLDVQWFADAVVARHDEIVRDLARGRLRPIFDVDERDGEVLWEAWIDGFAEAMALRPDAWTGEAAARMATLVAIARDESGLDSIEINAFQDRATAEIVAVVQRLHDESPRRQQAPDVTPQGKAGRNDPCPCGSGKKFKRCCGGVA